MTIDRIKFRGKCEQGDWRYTNSPEEMAEFWMNVNDEFIDKETVGQWTGLVDKNGADVYEGDVVACKEDSGNIVTGEVVFGKQNGAWCAFFPQFGTGVRSPLLNFISGTMCAAASSEFEIVGNIHEVNA